MTAPKRAATIDAARLAKAKQLADLYVLAKAKAENREGYDRLVQCFLEHPEWMKGGTR